MDKTRKTPPPGGKPQGGTGKTAGTPPPGMTVSTGPGAKPVGKSPGKGG